MKKQLPIKYLYNMNPLYVHFKKHYCPNCGVILKVGYSSIVVNSKSLKAQNYDFSIGAGDSNYKGDVEFRESFFLCPKCGLKIDFQEMKRKEKNNKQP